jgi:ectoine hydroxylase-related dioxygenase (phytanoyl-CoA dioxygenase family)
MFRFLKREFLGDFYRWHLTFFVYLRHLIINDFSFFLKNFLTIFGMSYFPSFIKIKKKYKSDNLFDPKKMASEFWSNGYVVVHQAIELDKADEIFAKVDKVGQDILRLDQENKIPKKGKHGAFRYSFGDAGLEGYWNELGQHSPKVLEVLKEIWKHQNFYLVAAGGEMACPGAVYQPIHSDLGWKAAGDSMPCQLVVNFYVSDVKKENGPMRIIPGTSRFPSPSSIVNLINPKWMRDCTVEGVKGTAVIRDPRCWHGGTPNVSNSIRYMPNCEFILEDKSSLEKIAGQASINAFINKKFLAKIENT